MKSFFKRSLAAVLCLSALVGAALLVQNHKDNKVLDLLIEARKPVATNPAPKPLSVVKEQFTGDTVKVIGREAKYPIYDLPTEDLDALKYTDSRGLVWTPDLLIPAVKPIEQSDVNQGDYRCEFICVNTKNEVVGRIPL